MKKNNLAADWMKRAKSDYKIALNIPSESGIYYEDLCYHAQQTAEKALKAVLTCLKTEIPRTHDIELLLNLICKQGIKVSPVVRKISFLSNYAVITRYPGDYSPVTKKEYKRALALAKRALDFAGKIILQSQQQSLF